MITCHLVGGLGNQLFQIFTTIAYSIQSKQPFGFLNSYRIESITERHSYWDTFLLNLKNFTHDNLNEEFEIVGEKNFHYNKLPIDDNNDDNYSNDCEKKSKKLIGYFQSYRYFESYFENICSLLSLSYLKKQITNEYLQYFCDENLISMHFRLGDYKRLPDYHPILSVEYYIQSLNKIFETLEKKDVENKTYRVLFFCEKEDNEDVQMKIEVLKKEFPTIGFIKADDSIEDWKQMLIMSCCKHNIIANSSFSWWGGHFNIDKEKIVCYPKVWFGPKMSHHNLDDLFPPSWNKIDF
jgi:hypothetical protein